MAFKELSYAGRGMRAAGKSDRGYASLGLMEERFPASFSVNLRFHRRTLTLTQDT